MRSILALFPLAAAAGCSSTQTCTDLGCFTGVHFRSPLRFTSTQDLVDLSVCKNGVCAHGTATTTACSLSGAIDVHCTVTVTAGNATIAFDVPAASADDLKSGDTYTFRVQRGQTNETLVDVTKPATTYTTTQPNGPSCGPTCKSADLT